MIVVSDKQGDACESQDEFEGYDKDVLHNSNGFISQAKWVYKLGEMAHIQFSKVLERPEVER